MQVLEAVAALTGFSPVRARQLGGGDTAAAYEVELAGGELLFAKAAPEDMPTAARAEATSLSWLGEPGVVAVPAVHGHDEHWLVTDHLRPAAPTEPAAEQLGRGLARLHSAGASSFGAAPPGGPADAWIGLAPMRNQPEQDWPTFYVAHRVEPYLREAVDSGVLGPGQGEVISEVCERIEEIAGPAEPPARLHGDLWSGNVHWGDSDGETRAWLIDPAAHGGHRETDLAMLQLFGCPHLERVLRAYQEVSPLADGWRERVGLHQLFPLLVHTVLFGGGYADRAVSAARSALRAG